MELCKKWSVSMKDHISGGGVMLPAVDPFDPSAFYVSDGWGSCYGSIRLRKLSVETGEELASILTRDCARCIHVEEDRLFAILNKRILELDRSDLSVIRTHKKSVPLYMDHTAFDSTDKLLLMNRNGSFLNVFDLTAGTVRKKKAETCCGIFKEDTDHFLICTSDGISRYTLSKNQFERLMDVEHCIDCAQGPSGKLYLLCHEPAGEKEPFSHLLAYAPGPDSRPQKLVSHIQAKRFSLSKDGQQAVFFWKDHLHWKDHLQIYPLTEDRVIFQRSFEEENILEDSFHVFDENAVLTYQWKSHMLTCWKTVGQVC